jgi:hypothetical protein
MDDISERLSKLIHNVLIENGKVSTILFRINTGVPELPHDILIAYSGVKIKTKIERKNVEGPIVSIP